MRGARNKNTAKTDRDAVVTATACRVLWTYTVHARMIRSSIKASLYASLSCEACGPLRRTIESGRAFPAAAASRRGGAFGNAFDVSTRSLAYGDMRVNRSVKGLHACKLSNLIQIRGVQACVAVVTAMLLLAPTNTSTQASMQTREPTHTHLQYAHAHPQTSLCCLQGASDACVNASLSLAMSLQKRIMSADVRRR